MSPDQLVALLMLLADLRLQLAQQAAELDQLRAPQAPPKEAT